MLLPIAFTVAVGLSFPAATASDAALDAGRTLTRVDKLRAQGEYDDAAQELRGWIERWNNGSIYDASFLSQVDRMRDLMKKMVEMQELLQRAALGSGTS